MVVNNMKFVLDDLAKLFGAEKRCTDMRMRRWNCPASIGQGAQRTWTMQQAFAGWVCSILTDCDIDQTTCKHVFELLVETTEMPEGRHMLVATQHGAQLCDKVSAPRPCVVLDLRGFHEHFERLVHDKIGLQAA